MGFPGGTSGEESACQSWRHSRLDFWVRKIPLKEEMATLSRKVSLPGKFHRQRSLEGYSPSGCKQSDMTEHPQHTSREMRKVQRQMEIVDKEQYITSTPKVSFSSEVDLSVCHRHISFFSLFKLLLTM